MRLFLLLPLLLLIPDQALAWGGGTHLQLGAALLADLPALSPAVAAVIGAHPHDFLYGTIAADITFGKKFTHYLLHCHRWNIGRLLLERTETEPQRACAYGYLAHLAMDSVAHGYFVPYKIMRSFATVTMKHAYWEMRFETFVEPATWELARQVANHDYQANDKLLRKVMADTIFSFGTNKRIFNSILLVSRLEQWQQAMRTVAETSRYAISTEDRDEYMLLATEAAKDLLTRPDDSPWLQADPTGERALATAEAVRKNLRILYRSGKISKEQAGEMLEEFKVLLAGALFKPEKLALLHTQ